MESVTKSYDLTLLTKTAERKSDLDYFNENAGHVMRECKGLIIKASGMSISKYISIDALKMEARDIYTKGLSKGKSRKTSLIGSVSVMLERLVYLSKDIGIHSEDLVDAIDELDVIFCMQIELE